MDGVGFDLSAIVGDAVSLVPIPMLGEDVSGFACATGVEQSGVEAGASHISEKTIRRTTNGNGKSRLSLRAAARGVTTGWGEVRPGHTEQSWNCPKFRASIQSLERRQVGTSDYTSRGNFVNGDHIKSGRGKQNTACLGEPELVGNPYHHL